jgi:molecular chaperone DnaK (HSP70)
VVALDRLSATGPALAGGEDGECPVIPSVVEVLDARGRRAFVGQEALARNWAAPAANLARSFKLDLAVASERAVCKAAGQPISARVAATLLIREVLRAVRQQRRPAGLRDRLLARLGRWPTSMAIPVPVDAYELYGREVRAIARRCGVGDVQVLEEPVAAALGYGVDLTEPRTLLVVDFGGGTLDIAVVRVAGDHVTAGRSQVLAVGGRSLGGNTVDEWLMEEYCRRSGAPLDLVRHDLAWRAQVLKHRLSRPGAPTEEWGGSSFSREELRALLTGRGLYDQLAAGIHQVLSDAEMRAGGPVRVDDAILTGGSTMLVGVAGCVEMVLARRVRRWRPFDAVARGAALFAAGCAVERVIYHDYSLRVRVPDSTPPTYEFERLIPSGEPYPTLPGREVVRYYAAAFPGQEEVSLPVCEMGRFRWEPIPWEARANGQGYWRPRAEPEWDRVVCLNEADPEIPLRPAGLPGAARLRVTFRVDERRWLRVTVHDLQRRLDLRQDEALVELR